MKSSKNRYLHQQVLWALAMAVPATLSCTSSEQRTSVSGTGQEVIIKSSADAAPAEKVPGASDDGKGSQLTGKSLEQCTAEKKAWRAVVDSGNSPSECSEALVNWCCTRKEVLARFPTTVEKIETEFAKYIDGEGHVLYHCSTDGGTKTTFHMAKVVGAQVFYRTVFVDKVFPVDTGSKNDDCPVVTTNDLTTGTGSVQEPEVGEGESSEVAEPQPQTE